MHATLWTYGPEGELGVGDRDWERFRGMMKGIWLPAMLIWMFLSRTWPMFFIWMGSTFVIARLSRLEGTPELVEGATVHWVKVFLAGAAGFFVLHLLDAATGSGFFEFLNVLGGWAFFLGTTFYLTASRMLSWEPPRKVPAADQVSMAMLREMRDEVAAGPDELASLPVFDAEDVEPAWSARDPERVAKLLAEGEMLTRESWGRAMSIHNAATVATDVARAKLRPLLERGRAWLVPFRLDYRALELQGSKLGHIDMAAPIPPKLTAKALRNRSLALMRPGSTVVAKAFTGGATPAQALVGLAVTIVAHEAHRSRALRQLRDAQGQLEVNAQAARGDFTLLADVLSKRILPKLDRMLELIGAIEAELAAVPQAGPDDLAAREKAMRLAMLVVEGQALASTTAGIEMNGPANDATALLAAARERGREVLGATPLPEGLSHFTEYAGLISRALELGALLATETRDLKAIAAHHDVEIRRIEAAFREVEAGMLADFARDAALRERTFAVIDALVAAGQYEVALKMYERMHDGFTRGALETIIDHRNHIASGSTVRIRLK